MTTGRQFEAFLTEKWGEESCPRCGATEWVFHSGDASKGMESELLVAMIPATDNERYMGVYTMHCSGCGEVHSFSSDVVDIWSAEHG